MFQVLAYKMIIMKKKSIIRFYEKFQPIQLTAGICVCVFTVDMYTNTNTAREGGSY